MYDVLPISARALESLGCRGEATGVRLCVHIHPFCRRWCKPELFRSFPHQLHLIRMPNVGAEAILDPVRRVRPKLLSAVDANKRCTLQRCPVRLLRSAVGAGRLLVHPAQLAHVLWLKRFHLRFRVHFAEFRTALIGRHGSVATAATFLRQTTLVFWSSDIARRAECEKYREELALIRLLSADWVSVLKYNIGCSNSFDVRLVYFFISLRMSAIAFTLRGYLVRCV